MLFVIVLVAALHVISGQITTNSQVKVTPDYRQITFQLKDDVTTNKSLTVMVNVSPKSNHSTAAALRIGKQFIVKNMPLNQKVYFTLFANKNYVEAKTKDPSLAASSVTVTPGKPLNLRRCGTDNLCWETPENVQNATNVNDKSIEYHVSVCDYNQLTEENTNCELKAAIVDRFSTHSNSSQSTSVLESPSKSVFTAEGNFELYDHFYPRFELSKLPNTKDLALVVKPVTLANTDGEADQLNFRLEPSKEPTAPVIRVIMPVANSEKVFVAWSGPDNWLIAEKVKYRVEYRTVNETSYKNVDFKQLGGTWPNDTNLATNWGIELTSSNGAPLKMKTLYKFRVGISSSNYGSSKWSYGEFKTETWPTSMSIVTSPSIVLIITLAFIVVNGLINHR